MKTKLKSNKAITLIALIITIIVMLILVGVVISVVINSNLLGTAKDATARTKTAYDEEANWGDNIGGTQAELINKYLKSKDDERGPIKIEFTLKYDNKQLNQDELDDRLVGSVTTDGVPIPVGFTASSADKENTKAGGLVIYEGTEAVTNANVETARTTRNQFVWVPVLQNQKLKLEITSKETITKITLKDPLYREMTIPAPSGKTYSAEIEPSINGLYTVTVEAGGEEATKTLEVSTLYAQDFFIDPREYTIEGCKELWPKEQFIEWETKWTDNQQELNEYLMEEYGTTNIDEAYEVWVANCSILSVALYYTDSTIEDYKDSVEKYGGFYIARYEAGCDEERDYGDELTTVYSKKNKYPYGYINQADAIGQSNEMYNTRNITSSLINAAAWDRTLNWLMETKAVTKAEMFVDSSTWGNHASEQGSIVTVSELLKTGESEHTRKNNIYDLAGNVWEWTTEQEFDDEGENGVERGGDCSSLGMWEPVSDRSPYVPSRDDTYFGGFRPTLYINTELRVER